MAKEREFLDLTAALEGGLWSFTASAGPGTRKPHTHRELEVNVVMQGEAQYVVKEAHYEQGAIVDSTDVPLETHIDLSFTASHRCGNAPGNIIDLLGFNSDHVVRYACIEIVEAKRSSRPRSGSGNIES